jgi:Coenzyme PQQ synthesis protein D (PqqD)
VSVARALEGPDGQILASRARLPEHVVYRSFVNETVVLNLETGRYHGVNPVGGRMLEALERAETVADAVGRLHAEFGDVEGDELERDVCAFCADLLERGLIQLSSNGRG